MSLGLSALWSILAMILLHVYPTRLLHPLLGIRMGYLLVVENLASMYKARLASVSSHWRRDALLLDRYGKPKMFSLSLKVDVYMFPCFQN